MQSVSCVASRAYIRFGAIAGDWLVSDVDGTQLLCSLRYTIFTFIFIIIIIIIITLVVLKYH
jgi:hypothetical protein